MAEEDGYSSIDVRLIDEPLPTYSTSYGQDWEEIRDEKADRDRGLAGRFTRSVARHPTTQCVVPLISSSAQSTSKFFRHQAWPAVKKYPFKKKQSLALLLLLSLGIVPFFGYGKGSSHGGRYFKDAFSAKVIDCGDGFGEPQNATVDGIEGLFVLDASFGGFTFPQAKIIDVAWDSM